MAERAWSDLIEEGRRLVSQEGNLRWQWGDLALEVEPLRSSPGGAPSGTFERLNKWADEIGFSETGLSFDALKQYRHVAHYWPPTNRRNDVTWSVHRALQMLDDRFDVIASRKKWTMEEAYRAAGREVAPSVEPSPQLVEQVRSLLRDPQVARVAMEDPQVRHVVDEARPSEDRAEQARRLVRDPAVARHVVQDNAARSAMARAAKEMEDEAGERQRERAPGLVNLSDFYQATGELSRARQSLTKALDAMRRVDLSEDERESLKEDAGRARLVLEWIGSYLESGDHSFDKELDALLREE